MKKDVLYETIIDNLDDGVYFVDLERRITFWNKAAERISGYKSEEILGRLCQDNILNHIDVEGRPLCLVGCPLFATMGDGKGRIEEVLMRHKSGHRIAVNVKTMPVYQEGAIVGAVEIFSPKSKAIYDDNLVDSLSTIAMTDMLTSMPNRKFLESHMDYRLQEFYRFGSNSCILFLDIDDFSNFNDTYGHHMGDEVLRNLAFSFKSNMRDTDKLGRWGGEEFVGIFSINHPSDVRHIAEKIRLLVESTEIPCGDNYLSVTASVGGTCVREGDTVENIVKRADALMYLSKKRGKNCSTTDCPGES